MSPAAAAIWVRPASRRALLIDTQTGRVRVETLTAGCDGRNAGPRLSARSCGWDRSDLRADAKITAPVRFEGGSHRQFRSVRRLRPASTGIHIAGWQGGAELRPARGSGLGGASRGPAGRQPPSARPRVTYVHVLMEASRDHPQRGHVVGKAISPAPASNATRKRSVARCPRNSPALSAQMRTAPLARPHVRGPRGPRSRRPRR